MQVSPKAGLIALLATLIMSGTALGETCTRSAARKVVDEAGARLRVLTAETQPKIQAKIRQLKEKRGWTDAAGEEKAAALLSDARTVELDAKSAGLLARIDELSEGGTSAAVECAKIGELEAASIELQATIRAKSQHIITRLDQEIAGGSSKSAVAAPMPDAPKAPPSVSQTATAPSLKPALTEKSVPAKEPAKTAPPVRKVDATPPTRVEPPKPKPQPPSAWSTETVTRQPLNPPPPRPDDAYRPPQGPGPQAGAPPMPPTSAAPGEGFSKTEIAEASRGFFGTISGGLATVIEHAFSTLGTPSAYVLGSEGGGAFIAGVRYGKGSLFMRDGTRRELYWHGPSIGYDVGASGAKTMFLVYNLKRDIDIFSGFSGIEGSAYLVGGVGMTVLTDGKVVMAPIRSGLGLRLGANVGYIRFTARPTWNPF